MAPRERVSAKLWASFRSPSVLLQISLGYVVERMHVLLHLSSPFSHTSVSSGTGAVVQLAAARMAYDKDAFRLRGPAPKTRPSTQIRTTHEMSAHHFAI